MTDRREARRQAFTWRGWHGKDDRILTTFAVKLAGSRPISVCFMGRFLTFYLFADSASFRSLNFKRKPPQILVSRNHD